MDSDLYTDGPAPAEEEGSESEQPKDSDSSTAILPKALFAGKECKVGDDVTLRITRINQNDVEVEYPGEGADEEAGEGGEPMPPQAEPMME